MAIRARARELFSGFRSADASTPGPERPRFTRRVVVAMGLGVVVAQVWVALAFDGLDLPLSLYLPAAIVVGAGVTVVNGRYAWPKDPTQAATQQELWGVPTTNGAKAPRRGTRLRLPGARFLVSVVVAFLVAECATMMWYRGDVAERVLADRYAAFRATHAGSPERLRVLEGDEAELTVALGRTVDGDPAVAALTQEFARVQADLDATEQLLPCGSVVQCPSRYVTRLGKRDDLRARLSTVGGQLQVATDRFRAGHTAQVDQRTAVQAEIRSARSGYYDAVARLLRGNDGPATAGRIRALVAIEDERLAVAVVVPGALFLAGFLIDFGGLWIVARGRSGHE